MKSTINFALVLVYKDSTIWGEAQGYSDGPFALRRQFAVVSDKFFLNGGFRQWEEVNVRGGKKSCNFLVFFQERIGGDGGSERKHEGRR